MINTDRIVPVQATDLITLYGTIMKLAGTSVAAAEASAPGEFTLPSDASGNLLAAEPVTHLDFGEVSAAVVYFVPAFDYKGFAVDGTDVTTAGAEVKADGATLYTATLSSGTVTIAKKGF